MGGRGGRASRTGGRPGRARDAEPVSEDIDPLDPDESGYWAISRRPLQVLVFLLPLVLVYEIGLAWLLRSEEGVVTNKAHETLLATFEALGVNAVGGLYLGGVVIVVVLLVWHLLNRDPWWISPGGLGLMALESVALTMPLIVMGLLVQRGVASIGPTELELARLDILSRLAISIGAGIYEELLFRWMLIAIVHTLLVDMAKARPAVGAAVAVVVSALAFTMYHPLRDAGGGVSAQRIVFYFLAGIYFGLVFLLRGFGIVVAVHTIYDVITVMLLSEPPAA